MAHILEDLVRETSVTTGTGDLQLAGAVSGCRTFSAVMADGDTSWVRIKLGTDWERAKVRYNSGANSLTRLSVYRSTNANAAVSFGSGAKDIILDLPGLTEIPAADQGLLVGVLGLEIVIAQMAMAQADLLNVAQFLGSSGNRLADSFDALTYVNTGGATNLDSSVAGLLKPSLGTGSQISTSGKTPIGNMTLGGGLAAGFDGNTSQTYSGTAPTASNVAAGFIGIDWGTPTAVKAADIIASNNQGFNSDGSDPTITLELEGSTDNFSSSVVSLGTVSAPNSWTTSNGVTKTVTASSATAYRYHRIKSYLASGNIWPTFSEVKFYAPLSNNMTVNSASLSAASAPSSMKIVALVNHVDSATAGTDYKFKVSRDGGSHLSGYLTLNDRFTIPGGTIHVIESDAIDVTGITSGTTPLWQFESFNNKAVELQGLYFYWT